MVRTRQSNIFGREHYTIYINGVFFAEFNSICLGEEIAQEISLDVFGKLADH
jgi:hypothetical protein